jgi:hypothetical protein
LIEKILNMKKKEAKDLETLQARFVADHGVRNTSLEDLHSGTFPSSKSGDYSDVKVVTPYGEIPWTELSRISDEEMRKLMLDVEKQIKKALSVFETVKTNFSTEEFQKNMTEILFVAGVSWDMDYEEINKRLGEKSDKKKK